MKTFLAIVACVAFCIPAPVLAATRRCNAVAIRGHHVITPAVVLNQYAPPYVYEVGAGIQQEALAAQVATLVLKQLAAQHPNPAQAQGQPTESPALPTRNLLQSCTSCHNGKNPKTSFDMTIEMSCEQKLESVKRMLLPPEHPDHMPKNRTLTPNELGDTMGAIVGAHPDQQPAPGE